MADLTSTKLPACAFTGMMGPRCEADDPRVCWAIRHPEAYLRMGKNPRCSCPCHTATEDRPRG